MDNTIRYPSLYVDRLGRQLRLWREYGISDSKALKLLQLWIGFSLVMYMDSRGRYTFHSFNALRLQLGFRTVDEMIELVRRSRSFVLLSCDIKRELIENSTIFTPLRPSREFPDHLTAFFSPLWHKLDEKDGDALAGSIAESCKCNCKCDDIDNNTLSNNILSGGSANAAAALEAADEASLGSESIADVEAAFSVEMRERIDKGREWMQSLATHVNPMMREPVIYLMRWLQSPVTPKRGTMRGFGLTEEEALQVIDVLFAYELAPHFARDKNFWDPRKKGNPDQRIYQFRAYVMRYCTRHVKAAVQRWRRRQEARQVAACRREERARRSCRPISPYEWQDADGLRWMEDSSGTAIQIKADAPPRPSAGAQWNYVDGKWIES